MNAQVLHRIEIQVSADIKNFLVRSDRIYVVDEEIERGLCLMLHASAVHDRFGENSSAQHRAFIAWRIARGLLAILGEQVGCCPFLTEEAEPLAATSPLLAPLLVNFRQNGASSESKAQAQKVLDRCQEILNQPALRLYEVAILLDSSGSESSGEKVIAPSPSLLLATKYQAVETPIAVNTEAPSF